MGGIVGVKVTETFKAWKYSVENQLESLAGVSKSIHVSMSNSTLVNFDIKLP